MGIRTYCWASSQANQQKGFILLKIWVRSIVGNPSVEPYNDFLTILPTYTPSVPLFTHSLQASRKGVKIKQVNNFSKVAEQKIIIFTSLLRGKYLTIIQGQTCICRRLGIRLGYYKMPRRNSLRRQKSHMCDRPNKHCHTIDWSSLMTAH